MLTRRHVLAAPSLLATAAPAPTNIVVIFCDDLGYGDLACYGHPTIRTPHLDQMAREGVRFTEGYSASALCSPSRASLLTGRLPLRHGITEVLAPNAPRGLAKTEITIPQMLQPHGYESAIVGKWHLGDQPADNPLRYGFSSWFGIPYSNDMSPSTNAAFARKHNAPPTPLMRDEKQIETEPDQTQLTIRYTEEANRFVTRKAKEKKPFFLYLAHSMPHYPLSASPRFRGKSRRGLYGDVIEELDWSVGEILRNLRSTGVEQNTAVFFTSDNGPWLIKREAAGSAGLLRDGKGSTWEGGHRVPFLARCPGRFAAGHIAQSFACTLDLLPTCAALSGATAPQDRTLDGKSLLPQLEKADESRAAWLPYYQGKRLQALRQGRWKIHWWTNSQLEAGPAQQHTPPLLFDLATDPSEKYNVADANPGVLKQLEEARAAHERSLVP
jgi:arylsulfatase A